LRVPGPTEFSSLAIFWDATPAASVEYPFGPVSNYASLAEMTMFSRDFFKASSDTRRKSQHAEMKAPHTKNVQKWNLLSLLMQLNQLTIFFDWIGPLQRASFQRKSAINPTAIYLASSTHSGHQRAL
jgi:hypothetical protein